MLNLVTKQLDFYQSFASKIILNMWLVNRQYIGNRMVKRDNFLVY